MTFLPGIDTFSITQRARNEAPSLFSNTIRVWPLLNALALALSFSLSQLSEDKVEQGRHRFNECRSALPLIPLFP